jgi:hypothetical protein
MTSEITGTSFLEKRSVNSFIGCREKMMSADSTIKARHKMNTYLEEVKEASNDLLLRHLEALFDRDEAQIVVLELESVSGNRERQEAS